jgi:hypothetical protein
MIKNQNLGIYRKFSPYLNERCQFSYTVPNEICHCKGRIQDVNTSQALLQKYSEPNNSRVMKANKHCRKDSDGT